MAVKAPAGAVRDGEEPCVAERGHARLAGRRAAEEDHELPVAPAHGEGCERVHGAVLRAALVRAPGAGGRLQLRPAACGGPGPCVAEHAGRALAAKHEGAFAEASQRGGAAARRLHALGLLPVHNPRPRSAASAEAASSGSGEERTSSRRPRRATSPSRCRAARRPSCRTSGRSCKGPWGLLMRGGGA